MFKKLFITSLILILSGILQLNVNHVSAQIETAKMKNLNIQLDNAFFLKSSVYKLIINAQNVDFSTGNIGLLSITTLGFQLKNLILDEVNLTVKNVLFDTESLFSKKELLLSQPVEGTIYIIVTENGLNTILNQPKVTEKLANLATAKIQKFGIELNSGLVSFNRPRGRMLPDNVIQINMYASLANLLEFPISFNSKLEICNSKLILTSPKIVTSGIILPEDIAQKINVKLNTLMDFEEKFDDELDINITSLKILPGDRIIVNANALIKKLKFSKKAKVNK